MNMNHNMNMNRNTNVNRNMNVNRNTNVNRNANVNVNRNANVNVNRNVGYHGGVYRGAWVGRPYHWAPGGAITAGAAIGFITAGTAVAGRPRRRSRDSVGTSPTQPSGPASGTPARKAGLIDARAASQLISRVDAGRPGDGKGVSSRRQGGPRLITLHAWGNSRFRMKSSREKRLSERADGICFCATESRRAPHRSKECLNE